MLNVLLTGATGFIGTAVRQQLPEDVRVFGLTRQPPRRLSWPQGVPVTSVADIDQPLDVVINLAGENIGAQRWSIARKTALRDSRIQLTETLGRELKQLGQQPQCWINASAVGYYGDHTRADAKETVDEKQPAGADFAAQLCCDWERAAAEAARTLAVQRLCILRFGVVIGPGGMLTKLRLPFALGLGAVMGPGPQHMAWISHADAIRVLLQAVNDAAFEGVLNVVAPQAVSQQQFADTLARVLGRPRFLRVPAPILRLLMGQMADLLLFDQPVVPSRLLAQQFAFQHPELASALNSALFP